jgi:general secretion pathway protein D
VPLDKSSVIVAMDSPDNRDRLERQVEETIFLPGLTTEQINDLAQVVRSIFDVKQASIERGLGSIILRAPQDVLDPLNVTLKDLIDGTGEVMIEVKLYEVDHTNSLDAGAAIPTQFTAFNVDQAANEIVNSNQTLVQQAMAQGYVTAGTSNLEIALALIQLGLVHSDLATNLIGVFGGGLLKTGISGATNATFNLGLNSSDTRTLDDVQLRVGEHEQAIFREGLKYPIALSTYSSGVSGAGSALGNASINGVSLASLIAPFTGGGSTTIPQITYEDLGVTLNATPVIEKSGRINLLLDLKLEALSGGSLNGNPILNSRRFATELTVADGESALMVSDVNKDESDAITGLPGLSELPGFQTPLDGTRERDNSQLVVVVTPHVVRRRSSVIAGPRIPMPPLPDE